MTASRSAPLVALALLTAACGTRRDKPDRHAGGSTTAARIPTRVALVQCEPSESALEGGLCRIQVTRVDSVTLSGVKAEQLPQIIGDTLVTGGVWPDSASGRALMVYHISSHALRLYPLPDGMATDVAVASDAHAVAFVSMDRNSGVRGTARRFPDGALLFQTPRIVVGETDATVAHVRWTAGDTLELQFLPESLQPRERWLRFRRAPHDSAWIVDTITPHRDDRGATTPPS